MWAGAASVKPESRFKPDMNAKQLQSRHMTTVCQRRASKATAILLPISRSINNQHHKRSNAAFSSSLMTFGLAFPFIDFMA